jgi:integrase
MNMPKARNRDGITIRNGYYRISYIDAQGRRKREKTSARNLTEARDLRAIRKTEAEKCRMLGIVPTTKDSFGEWAPRYLQHQKARLTAKAYQRTEGVVNKHLLPRFGKLRLADLVRGDIERYVTSRLTADDSGVSKHTVRKEFNILKHVFAVAEEQELIRANPAQGVTLPRVPAPRLRYLQPGELHNLLQALPPWMQPIASLLVFTGMRRGELLGLRWRDVDLKGNRILLPQSKNGEGRIIYLSAMARAVVDQLPAGAPVDPLFPAKQYGTPANVSLTLLRTCRKLKIANFRLHDLRHTCASWLVMSGADIYTVSKVLGHKSTKMTAIYAHLSPAHLQTAVSGLDRVLALPEADPEQASLPVLPPPPGHPVALGASQ